MRQNDDWQLVKQIGFCTIPRFIITFATKDSLTTK